MRLLHPITAVFLISSWLGYAAAAAELDVSDIKVALVNDDGRAIKTFAMPSNPSDRNLFFRFSIDPRYAGYKRAVIEIADKEKSIGVTIDVGSTPRSVITWNGEFSGRKEIEPGTHYLVRGILYLKNGKSLSSAWSPFNVKKRSVYDEAKRVRQTTLSLYVLPNGAVHSMLLLTKSQKAFNFPNVYGDVQLIYENTHTLMLKIEASSNLLFGIKPTADGYFYSDISFFYKYRLLGSPVRTPSFPPEDPTGRGKKFNFENAPRLYGDGLNTEVGFRLFSTTLRGAGNAPLDSEVPRYIEGAAAVFWADYNIDPLRFYISGELGYSVFAGKMISAVGDFSVVYTRLASFAPGLQVRAQVFSGNSQPDEFSGTTTETPITTALVTMGVVLKFKL